MVERKYNSGNEEEEKHPFLKVLGINFIIFVIYYLAGLGLVGLVNYSSSINTFFITTFYGYIVHAAILFIIALVKLAEKDYKKASAYFLTAILLLIVGFGACFFVATGGRLF